MKKMIYRHKNRLEKLIMACVNKEIKPHWGSLWGQKHWCTPAYCGIVQGNGRQVVWLKTGDSRPDYYILRIDSKENVDSDDFNIEILYEGAEDKYGNVNDYKEVRIDDKYLYQHWGDDEELVSEDKVTFPMLSTGNGGWYGSVKIFPAWAGH